MKVDPRWLPRAALILWLSAIFTLYLAPTPQKYEKADALALLLLIPLFVRYRAQLSTLLSGSKPLIPLLVLMAYVALQAWVQGQESAAGMHYVQQLLYGCLPYLLFYVVFRHLATPGSDMLLMAVLVIPGVVHLLYLYTDVFLGIWSGEIQFMFSSKHGWLEYIKNAPRVGRRYVSMALLHLLSGGLLVACRAKSARLRYVAWTLAGLSVLSIAVLDARAAYASVFIGALFLVCAVGLRKTWHSIKRFFQWHPVLKLLFVGVFVAAAALGHSAGKSRWVAMSYSLEWAVHDVFQAETPVSKRPYVDMDFWNAPLEDVYKCYLSGQFRCRADQSAYLRMAWLLEGARSLIVNPLGIGYSEDYMGRLWGVEGESNKYQRIDSFLVEHIVSFGWPAIVLYGWFFWGIVAAMRHAVRAGQSSAAAIILCALLLACVGRTFVDVFSEGLWRYMMALMGVYYGLLHAKSAQPKKD
ncbi:hypothetical protein [Hydrogenophaga sp.]|uniref:hypothetical protein n=1 Tax=Hydrogenophaga sp. TaxID=1904254 RepID=UPI00271C4E25|nr:hypothetical protein [Hydrogenophaga sp.]MDO9438426.1 hypothetical protein [Hydrogenophaga sp.]